MTNKRYKILKNVTTGFGLVSDAKKTPPENRVSWILYSKKPFRPWRMACSCGQLESIAEYIADKFIYSKRYCVTEGYEFSYEGGKFDLSFSLGWKPKTNPQGFFFSDTRELTFEERDRLLHGIGNSLIEILSKEKESN